MVLSVTLICAGMPLINVTKVHLRCCGSRRYTSGSHLGLGENIDISRQNSDTYKNKN